MTKPLLLVTLFAAACADGSTPKPGPQGEMGEKGDQGEMGEMGAMGNPGAPGAAGQSCWDLNGNRTCDLATEDQNDDNTCDVGDCIGPAGPAGAPGTPGVPGTTGQGALSVFGTTTLTVTPTSQATLIPGLTTTVNVPASSVLLISTDGGIATTSTAATGFSVVDIMLVVDGNLLPNGGYRRVIAANTTGLTGVFAPWSLTATTTLAPGSHTIQVFAAGVSGPTANTNATVSGDGVNVNQGELSVLVIKQ